MTLYELYEILAPILTDPIRKSEEIQIRIGDQVESGPYLHASVGGVFRGTDGSIILCANDDEQWHEEATGIDHNLPVLWRPT